MVTNQIALVTGTSRGIGRQICEHFLSQDLKVIGFSRSTGTIEHKQYRHFSVDISDEKSVQETFKTIRTDYGAIDILVNNAGLCSFQFVLLTPAKQAEEVLKTNVLGTFIVSREAAKLMLPRRYGRIINISSMVVPVAPAGGAIYSASKSALTQFTQVLSRELGDQNITCNVLGITAIESDMLKQLSKEKLDSIISTLPIKRLATIEDITHCLDFFVSRESSSITGQVVYLGGVF